MTGQSWSHRLVRPLVRPLVRTWVTPNHLTTLRLLIGLAACAALAVGEPGWTWWGGWLWVISLLLDYADGELARLAKMATPGGHAYDYAVDTAINILLFVAVGVGLRHSSLGSATIGLGLLAGGSVGVAGHWAEVIERRSPPGTKTCSGAFGFYPEDLLYLVGPLAWFDWLLPILVGAAIGGPLAMAAIGRHLRLHTPKPKTRAFDEPRADPADPRAANHSH